MEYQKGTTIRDQAAILLHIHRILASSFEAIEFVNVDDDGTVIAAVYPIDHTLLSYVLMKGGIHIQQSQVTNERAAINQDGQQVSIQRSHPVILFICQVVAGQIPDDIWAEADAELNTPERPAEPLDPDLGACCNCGTTEGVNNIIQLMRFAPERGKGWGHVTISIDGFGAVAVLCENCIAEVHNETDVKMACVGYPKENRRVPLLELEALPEWIVRRLREYNHAGDN